MNIIFWSIDKATVDLAADLSSRYRLFISDASTWQLAAHPHSRAHGHEGGRVPGAAGHFGGRNPGRGRALTLID